MNNFWYISASASSNWGNLRTPHSRQQEPPHDIWIQGTTRIQNGTVLAKTSWRIFISVRQFSINRTLVGLLDPNDEGNTFFRNVDRTRHSRTTGSPRPRQITLFSFSTSSHPPLNTTYVDFVKYSSDRPKRRIGRNSSGKARGCNTVPLTALGAYLRNDDSYVRNMAGITISWLNQNARRKPAVSFSSV